MGELPAQQLLDLTSVVLVLLTVFDWVVAAVLWQGYRQQPSRPLAERARLASAIALGGTVYSAIVALRLGHVELDGILLGFAIIAAAALPSLANLWWLRDYLRGRFTGPHEEDEADG